jgi:hypothetical protein
VIAQVILRRQDYDVKTAAETGLEALPFCVHVQFYHGKSTGKRCFGAKEPKEGPPSDETERRGIIFK